MVDAEDPSDRDALLGQLLGVLAQRGIAQKWADSDTPQADLDRECAAIASERIHLDRFRQYLEERPIIQRSVHALLAHISVAANARREHLPPPQDILFGAGSRVARWLPTFLLIDGPLGRFLRASGSPLNQALRTEHERFPVLAQARDMFNHDLFRRVRNGVGHWAFAFELRDGEERLICFDFETGERTADISLLEAEALHLAAFAVIECIDRRIFEFAASLRYVKEQR